MTEGPQKQTVQSLFGDPVPTFEPNTDVIEELERLLEMARSGEMVALTGIISFRDDCVSEVRAGVYGVRKVVGAMEIMKAGIIARIDDD